MDNFLSVWIDLYLKNDLTKQFKIGLV